MTAQVFIMPQDCLEWVLFVHDEQVHSLICQVCDKQEEEENAVQPEHPKTEPQDVMFRNGSQRD